MNELPQDPESERSLLSTLCASGAEQAALECSTVLRKEDFLTPAHRAVFEALGTVLDESGELSSLSIMDALKRSGNLDRVGGYIGLNEIIGGTEVGRPMILVDILQRHRRRRELIVLGSQMARSAQDGNDSPETITEAAGASLSRIAMKHDRAGIQHIGDFSDDALASIMDEMNGVQGNASWVKGWSRLNGMIGGFQPGLTILAARPSIGKCLGLGTPVLMFDGSIKLVESIVAGDVLMGPDSTPRNVLSTASGREEMFEVSPAKGKPWTCNRSHILSVVMSQGKTKRFTTGSVHNLAVDEVLALPVHVTEKLKLYRTGINWPEQSVDVDPYIMGVWLGDGSVDRPMISCPDVEIRDAVAEYAMASGMGMTEYRNGDKCPAYTIRNIARNSHIENSFTVAIRKAYVNGEKRIPAEYLVNSRDNRMKILAGLVDTDGYASSGCYEIITKWAGLRDDILFLARSLGLAAYASKKIGKIASIGFSGEYWRVIISGECSEVPVRISRKKLAPRKKNRTVLRSGFTLRSLGDGDYYGFEIDGDHLFVLGDFTVAHNTALALNWALGVSEYGKTVGIFSLEMTSARLWRRLASAHAGVDIRAMIADKNKADFNRLGEAKAELDQRGIWIDDRSSITHREIMGEVDGLIARQPNLGLLVVDHLGLMASSSESKAAKQNEATRIGEITRAFKNLAQDRKIPVLLLCQLNREVEKRQGGKPQLSDLRDSGRIEEDADNVFFIHRDTKDSEGTEAELIIAKQREGPLGTINLNFNPNLTKYTEIERSTDASEHAPRYQKQEEFYAEVV